MNSGKLVEFIDQVCEKKGINPKELRMGSRRGCILTGQAADSVSIGTGLWNPLGRSRPTLRNFYVCHFQGNYKENERVSQSNQLCPRPQVKSLHFSKFKEANEWQELGLPTMAPAGCFAKSCSNNRIIL